MKLHIISNDAFEFELQEYLCRYGIELLKNEIRKKKEPRKIISYCWLEDIKSWVFSFDRKYIKAKNKRTTTNNCDLRCLIISETDWDFWIEDVEDLEAFRLSKDIVRNYNDCYSEEIEDLRLIFPDTWEQMMEGINNFRAQIGVQPLTSPITVHKYLTLEE